MVYNSKKKVDSRVNAYNSQKDVFDWDLNTIETYERQENAPQRKLKYAEQKVQQNLYGSDVFNAQPIPNTDRGQMQKRYENSIKSRFSSDIFHHNNDTSKENVATKRPIKKYSNQESDLSIVPVQRKPINANAQKNLMSKENPFSS